MLHIVPILCLILFIGLVEYRLKNHLDETEKRLDDLEKVTAIVESIIKEDKKDENNSDK